MPNVVKCDFEVRNLAWTPKALEVINFFRQCFNIFQTNLEMKMKFQDLKTSAKFKIIREIFGTND